MRAQQLQVIKRNLRYVVIWCWGLVLCHTCWSTWLQPWEKAECCQL